MLPTEEFNEERLKKGTSVYDVVRIKEGTPLFLEAHLARLHQSVQHIQCNLGLSDSEIRSKIQQLAQINDVREGNLKLVFNFLENKRTFLAYFIQHQYPGPEQYREGVKTVLFQAIREIPNAKIINPWLRSTTNEIKEKADVYEVILLDRLGHITEGSRSNIFLIRDHCLHTAPLEDVLPGTVRQRVMAICEQEHIQVVEKRIYFEELPHYDAAFITGTSPMILPIRRINSLSMDVKHPLLVRLMKAHDQMISNYITKKITTESSGFVGIQQHKR